MSKISITTIANLITSTVIAFWIVLIAIISVQNYRLVSLNFLILQSIQIPFGIIIALSASSGMISMAIIEFFWNFGDYIQDNNINNAEFFVDEDEF